jgi:hypothetical protein
MPSLTSVYRAIVMIATGVIAVMGWQHYGPTQEQVKTFVGAALERAQTAWNGSQEKAANPPATVIDPRSIVPPVVAGPPLADAPPVGPAPQLVPLVTSSNDTPYGADEGAMAKPAPVGSDLENQDVKTLLVRLHELGGTDAQVGPWGSSGELYRCCCRAKFATTSPLARHFEAVADEPLDAVEQVVAKVEGWRSEQNLGR